MPLLLFLIRQIKQIYFFGGLLRQLKQYLALSFDVQRRSKPTGLVLARRTLLLMPRFFMFTALGLDRFRDSSELFSPLDSSRVEGFTHAHEL